MQLNHFSQPGRQLLQHVHTAFYKQQDVLCYGTAHPGPVYPALGMQFVAGWILLNLAEYSDGLDCLIQTPSSGSCWAENTVGLQWKYCNAEGPLSPWITAKYVVMNVWVSSHHLLHRNIF